MSQEEDSENLSESGNNEDGGKSFESLSARESTKRPCTMRNLNPSRQLSFEGNIADGWKRWKQLFENYLTASGGTNMTKNVKVATLLHVLEEEAIQKIQYVQFDSGSEGKLRRSDQGTVRQLPCILGGYLKK